ncbi:MAG: cytochrome c biogenesis protein ResB, partial [Elusimicrobia bacterium]|nr:cytochrome c biogenesis protein ResB [Elusimicrobiota bacterium]
QVRLANFSVEHYDSGKHWIQVANLKEGWNQVVEVQPGNEYWVNKSVRLNVLRYVPDFRVEKDAANGQWKTYSASLAPNNPALQVEVTASPKRMVWLFAKYPELSSHFTGETKNKENHLDLTYQFVPGKVKQFRSKIEIMKDNQVLANGETSVNHPFQYGGYNFFQSGYNPEDPSFSSFQVSKDPGVPVVYAGFVLLPLGLTLSFYGGRNT